MAEDRRGQFGRKMVGRKMKRENRFDPPIFLPSIFLPSWRTADDESSSAGYNRTKVPDQLACKLKYAMVEGYVVMKALLDDTGRIRVPDRVQADLGVKGGDELAWEEENGRWFLEAAGSKSAGAERASGPDDMSNSVTPRDRCAPSAVASDRDELNWEDMDYESLPLRRVGQVHFRIKRRGRLQPMPHHLDEE